MKISHTLQTVINDTFLFAKQHNHEFLTCEHLLLISLSQTSIKSMLSQLGADLNVLESELTQFLKKLPKVDLDKNKLQPEFSLHVQFAFQIAANHVQSSGKKEVSCEQLIIAFYRLEESHAVYFLEKQGIKRLKLVRFVSHGKKTTEKNNEAVATETHSEDTIDAIAAYCVNLTEKAQQKKCDPLIGRNEEIDRIIHVLARRKKNNPILVGDPGVGKTAILEGLASISLKKEAPEFLKEKTILSLQISTLMAGTKFRGELEERIDQLMDQLNKTTNTMLAIDEIHLLLGTGSVSTGSMDLAGLLKPLFSDGHIQCIGTTTSKEFRSIFEKDHALARRFQKIVISEPNEIEAVEILKGLKKHYESFHKVTYSDEVIKEAVQLSKTYIKDRCLPDNAIDLIDEAGATVKLAKKKSKVVTTKMMESLVCKIAQIPSLKIKKKESTQLKELDKHLKTMIYGQNHAIKQIVTAVQMQRAGISEPDKPIGAFLCAGPTGVGKTELAKQLAEKLGVSFLRFDMSEYMEKHTVSRLIGSPPGYVGHDQGGQLSEAIQQNPHCVLLLDEIEKAHHDLINILLQIMDHATVTDSMGRKIDFRHVVIIMTTNSGARESSQTPIGFKQDEYVDRSIKAIENQFSPEFRNRLTSIITFNPLPREVILKIVTKCLNETKALVEDKNITLSWHSDVVNYIANEGYDPKYGARNIKRVIQQQIKEALSKEMLFGSLTKGGSIMVQVKNKKIVFKK